MIFLTMLGIACFASAPAMAAEPAWWTQQKRDCGLPSNLAYNSWDGICRASSYDDGAAQRAREAAAAAAAAERQRQAEAERVERERLAEEKRQKDAKFIRDRDAAATTLKGGIGTSVAPNSGGLKGSSRVDGGLRGSSIETGLKELRSDDNVARDLRGHQAAWKQLHCAAALSGYAFAAVKKTTPDYQESSFLLAEAQRALEGQPLGVACPDTPPFPELHGRAVEMDQVKAAEKKILSRAAVIVERMQQRSNPPAAKTAPASDAAETPDEKMRRVQRELNDANRQKISGRTQQEIDQQEKDRKELANLILANSRLEKGELTSVSVNTGEEEAPRPRRKSVPVPAP
jgi:hypothetical protein